MKIEKIKLLFHTVSYLKSRQIYYRLYYFARQKWRRTVGFAYPQTLPSQSDNLAFEITVPTVTSYKEKGFVFLNLTHTFDSGIDWNFPQYGKLWTYNLTYFDFLYQKEMSRETGLMLINDFINQQSSIKDGLMPFPISLRGINWIKFLAQHKIEDQNINDSLYAQYFRLMDNIEYHILGNHLLENGFSLLFGAYYFQDETFYAKAKEILSDELEEQVLGDGAHFELSPMYHQIMLFRVMDCINLVQNNSWKEQELLPLLKEKAEMMLGWLNAMTFEDGTIPLLNDSANHIAPSTKELNDYAAKLMIDPQTVAFGSSGYRKAKNENYEMVMNVGNIGPDYIPGHAHSDTFNFVLYVNGDPFIVDTGLSTYETNQRRMLERSTSSHNTVEIDGVNQSEVWGGFRVARRAKIISLIEDVNVIEAVHDGYKRSDVLHKRKFTLNEQFIVIEDTIQSNSEHQAVSYLHFYPGIMPVIEENVVTVGQINIIFDGADRIELENYHYAPEFNKLIDAKKAKISFTKHLKMEIRP